MEPVLKTFVSFAHPGTMFNNESVREVADRSLDSLEVPGSAFAFQFYDRLFATAEVDGKEIELWSKSFNLSPQHYYGGQILTLKDIKKLPDTEILQNNMKNNGWKKVIRTRRGNWQPFDKDDIFIEEAA